MTPDQEQVKELLTGLAESFQKAQADNLALLKNHSESISLNRDTLAALVKLVKEQGEALNMFREALIVLWTDRFPEMPPPSDTAVN